MSYARKQAIITSLVWFSLFVYLVLVFAFTGMEKFSDSDHRLSRVLVAVVILPGYLLNLGILQWSKRARTRGDMDERDTAIATKASEVTLVILAMLVFVLSIILFESFKAVGVVPVGWLYFIAYGTMALVSFVHPTVALILDFGGMTDG